MDLSIAWTRLVESGDFAVFDEIAAAMVDRGDGAAVDPEAIERLLDDVVSALVQTDKAEAARVIDEYVARIWPARLRLGLGADGAGRIASTHEIRNLLATKTEHELGEAEAREGAEQGSDDTFQASEGSLGAERQGDKEGDAAGKDGRVTPDEPAASADFADNAGESLDELCRSLTRKSKSPVYRIMLVGMATAGKTFFLRRLANTSRGNYVMTGSRGFSNNEEAATGRTTTFTRNPLIPSDEKYPIFEIFDVPGEAFRQLNSNGYKAMAVEDRLRFYALLAVVDLLIFVEPALITLGRSAYEQHGDDIERAALDQMRSQLTEQAVDEQQLSVGMAQFQAELAAQRRKRLAAHDAFLEALAVLAKRIELLRKVKAPAGAADEADALKQRVEKFDRDFEFGDFAMNLERPLPIPALLLLSRADEYERMALPETDYDVDPAAMLLKHDPARFLAFARRFDAFATDFITSSRMETPQPQFHEETPHAGFSRLLDDWAIPAIRDSRQLAVRKGFLWRQRLRRHGMALRLRGWFDRDFRRLYAEAAG